VDSGPDRPTLKRRLATGGAWALAGKGGTLGLNFVTVALVARVLSPDDAGAYFLSQSLVVFAAMLTRLGLETTVVFLVSRALGEDNTARAGVVVRRVLFLGTLSALVAFGALSLGGGAYVGRALFHSELVASIGPSIGLWAASLSLQILVSEAFRGFHSIRDATLFGGLLSGLFTVIGILGLHLSGGRVSLDDAARVATLSTLASAVMAAPVLFRKAGVRASISSAAPTYGALLRESSPALVNNVMTFVLLNVDVWVLGAHLAERDVAVYAAAAKMVTLVSLTFMIANQVLPPVVGELTARGDKALLEKVLRGVAAAVGPPALLVLAAFVVAGPLVMRLAFGPFYESGAPILAVLAVAHVVGVFTGSTVTVLLMTGNQRAAMWISGAAAALATVAVLIAVRYGGTLGVAIAIAAVLTAQQLATLFAAKKLAGVWAHANFRLIRPALAEVMRRRKPR
jgi:O-antigen/teichoic acid export membrane protein